jgi:hypothetical protein
MKRSADINGANEEDSDRQVADARDYIHLADFFASFLDALFARRAFFSN